MRDALQAAANDEKCTRKFEEVLGRYRQHPGILRRKKEGNGDASSDKVDQKLTTTVMMMSCLVLCFPYDMPSFMPQLVCSLVRHKASHSLKDTVSQTVLEFKRTHQDRWEEFKTYFSADQLDSLINASHVSYCN